MRFPVQPTLVSAVAGGVDGVLAASDWKSGRAHQGITREYSTYYEAALIVGGAFAGSSGIHPDTWEPLIMAGAALLGAKLGAKASGAMASPAAATSSTPTTATASGRVHVMPYMRGVAQGQFWNPARKEQMAGAAG